MIIPVAYSRVTLSAPNAARTSTAALLPCNDVPIESNPCRADKLICEPSDAVAPATMALTTTAIAIARATKREVLCSGRSFCHSIANESITRPSVTRTPLTARSIA